MSGGGDDFTGVILAPRSVLTQAQARHVSLVLAGHARDAAELRDWLETVGLLAGPPGKRRKVRP